MDCTCPGASSLTTISQETCGVDLRQIQRLAFQRGDGAGFDQSAGTPRNIATLADWQAKQTPDTNERIILTPIIAGDPIIVPGDPITVGGGDNSTLNGIEEVQGENPSNFTCLFRSLSANVITQLRNLNCELDLKVYFILQGGLVAARQVTSTHHDGVSIQSVFTSDRGNNGFGTLDFFNHRFAIPSSWSEDLVIINPSFNPLTAI